MKIKVLHNEKDKKVLVSLRTHDYVSNEGVFIDGGQDGYVRYSIKEGWEYKEIDTSEIHQELCEFLKWGRNYDKEGNRLTETEFIQINKLETDHIKAILKTQNNINKIYKTVMEKELENRNTTSGYITVNSGNSNVWFDWLYNSFQSDKLIGNFNSSGNETIDKIKKLSSELVDLINSTQGDSEYKKLALINIAQGQMWAVKSLF